MDKKKKKKSQIPTNCKTLELISHMENDSPRPHTRQSTMKFVSESFSANKQAVDNYFAFLILNTSV